MSGQNKNYFKITVLCDNETTSPDLEKEWGLSMSIQLPDKNFWLWDAGATDLFLRNAEKLNVVPEKAVGLALSHGHWDHTGGMDALMDKGFIGPVYAHAEFASKRYSEEDDGSCKDASFSCRYPGTIIVRDQVELDEGIYMITSIKRRPGLFEATDGLFVDSEKNTVDTVPDDAFLLLDTPSGPVVILGCCHSGIANTLYHMQEVTGINKVHAILGGLHLYRSTEDQKLETAKVIEEFGTELVSPGHCSGNAGYEYLKEKLSCKVIPMGSGSKYEF
ncbi:MBL fold metallo-hydrolase [Maridesulfovibrio bastinii]|uniref:MBL fold metallo-hydrolase n=1 Tax=Maridesulfovibrio bastinii TaxID=47157 RepID=UPI0003FB07A9|nr:MBL fold metallo-hydrolase [Maridesulfovibrio bastinii]